MSPHENTHRLYRFGEFSLDLDREALFRGARDIHLRPKSLSVLRVLLENQRRLVTKAKLHDAAWKNSVVTDDSLTHCIADIRQALGESGFDMIQTVPRRGYIFDHVVTHEISGPPRTLQQRRRPAYRLGSIVVLLSAAILWVGAGRGGSERVDANAVDETNNAATMLETDSLQTNIRAQNEYRKGRFFHSRRATGDIDRAEASFKAALEIDPSFGAAWVGLSGVYGVKFGMGDMSLEDAMPLLGDATRHAVTLAPESAEAHARRACYLSLIGKPLAAQRHVEIAMVLEPDNVLILGFRAGGLADHGRLDEAIELLLQAIQGDPTSALLQHNLVWYMLSAGRITEAAAQAENYRALNPLGVESAGSELFADILILQGNHEQALKLVQEMPIGAKRNRNLAMIYQALGQEAQADAELTRLLAHEGEEAKLHVAEVIAHRGDINESISWLSRIWSSRGSDDPTALKPPWDINWLLSPYLIQLRDDKRWQTLYAHVLESRNKPLFVAKVADRAAGEMK
jgi:DNA-binding winged helix-turn-helix (wHTH) protein/Tfp pilus assembly protein PilF